MSTYAGKLYHPVQGVTEEIWEGFSWPCLLLCFIWFLYKEMWRWALISFPLGILTVGLSWFVFPFYANEMHVKSLLKRGYLTERQWNEKRQNEFIASGTISPSQNKKCPFCAETIKIEAIKCRYCGEKLDPIKDQDKNEDLENRILCSDGACVGQEVLEYFRKILFKTDDDQMQRLVAVDRWKYSSQQIELALQEMERRGLTVLSINEWNERYPIKITSNGFCTKCVGETTSESPGDTTAFNFIFGTRLMGKRDKCSYCGSVVVDKCLCLVVPVYHLGSFRVLYTRRGILSNELIGRRIL